VPYVVGVASSVVHTRPPKPASALRYVGPVRKAMSAVTLNLGLGVIPRFKRPVYFLTLLLGSAPWESSRLPLA